MTVFTAIDPVWRIDPDAAAYVSLANAVVAGEGYTLDGDLHAKYPPGWPLVVAGLSILADSEAYGLFHGALVVAWLLAVLGAHALARRLGFGPWGALALAACTGLSQTLFDLSVRYLRTEPLFLVLSLGALLFMLRALSPRGTSRQTALAALLVIAALSVRLAGVSLLAVPAVALLMPTRRKPAALALLALGGAGVLAWALWGGHVREMHPEAPDYRAEFLAAAPRDLTKVVQVDVPPLDGPAMVRRVAGNLDVMARASAVLLTNVDKAGARAPVGYATLALLALGLVSLWRRPREDVELDTDTLCDRRLVATYVIATLGLYLVWPFNQQERFYVPLLPMILVAAGEAVTIVRRLFDAATARPGLRRALLLAGALLLGLLLMQRSDDPSVLGRWSKSYAALLVAGSAGWLALAWWMRKARPLPWTDAACLLAPLLFLVPFAAIRFREWPETVEAFRTRRLEHAVQGPLANIDVHPALEEVALFLRRDTDAGTVVMTDVPKMLAILSGRRCVPFVYRAQPPEVLAGEADLVFYTREIPEAAAVIDACADRFEPVLELTPVDDGQRQVVPTVYRPR